jgi:hypothetical protein
MKVPSKLKSHKTEAYLNSTMIIFSTVFWLCIVKVSNKLKVLNTFNSVLFFRVFWWIIFRLNFFIKLLLILKWFLCRMVVTKSFILKNHSIKGSAAWSLVFKSGWLVVLQVFLQISEINLAFVHFNEILSKSQSLWKGTKNSFNLTELLNPLVYLLAWGSQTY